MKTKEKAAVVVTGGGGLLGGAVGALLTKCEAEFNSICLSSSWLDITDYLELRRALKYYEPLVIVNCAAYTNVDRAEIDRKKAFWVNVQGTQILGEEAARSGAHLIHISTDMVFDSSEDDRIEASIPAPVNWYGETKLQGERVLAEIKDLKYIIIRTAGLYDLKAEGGFPVRISEYVQKTGNPIRMSTKAIGCPTVVEDLAEVLHFILEGIVDNTLPNWEDHLLHVTGPVQSWAENARAILTCVYDNDDVLSNLCKETDIPTENPSPGRAARASRSVLNCERLKKWKDVRFRSMKEGLEGGLGEALRRRFLARR